MPSMVRVMSSRTVRPPAPRPRHHIPLTFWDAAMLSTNYIQRGLLFHKPCTDQMALSSTALVVDHLAAALADALTVYYPVAGRFATETHCDETGTVVGCSVHIDCDNQGVEVVHAVADGVSISDVIPRDADVPRVVESFFPLQDAVNSDGVDNPLFVVQVTDLADGLFLGFVYNHSLSDGTAFWNFVNFWAAIARARLDLTQLPIVTPTPVFERWSADCGTAAPVMLPCADLSELIERPSPPPLRERMLHFSSESLTALKERARQDLLADGDEASAAALTRFQALTSLLWRCITRARRLAPEQETTCRAAIDNRARLRPPLPQEYFGNTIYAIGTEVVRARELLERGHGWAAAAVGRAVAAHTDEAIRAGAAEWTRRPMLYTLRFFDPGATMMGSSPRFDMYGCDFGWGKPMAARSGRANKFDGKTSLYPGPAGGGNIEAELTLTPEHMAALDEDDELWAALTR